MNSSNKALLCLVFTMAAMIQSTQGASFTSVNFKAKAKQTVTLPTAFNKILKISDHTILLCTRAGTIDPITKFYLIPLQGNQVADYDPSMEIIYPGLPGESMHNCGVSPSIYQGFGIFTDKTVTYLDLQGTPKGQDLYPDTYTTPFTVHAFDNGNKVVGFGNYLTHRSLLFHDYDIGTTGPTMEYHDGEGPIKTLDSIKSKEVGQSSTFYLAADSGNIHKVNGEDATNFAGTNILPIGNEDKLGAIDQSSLLPHDILVGMIVDGDTPRLGLVSKDLEMMSMITANGNNAVLLGQIEAVPTFQGFFALTRADSGVDGYSLDLTTETSVFFINISDNQNPLIEDMSPRVVVGGEPILTLKFIGNHRILAAGHSGDGNPSWYTEIDFASPFETQCDSTCGSCKKEGAGHCLTCILNFSKSTDDGTAGTCLPDAIKDKTCGGDNISACVECSEPPATTCKKCLLNYGLNAKSSVGGTSCTECSDAKCLVCNEVGGDVCQQCIIGYSYDSEEKKCLGTSGSFLVSSFILGFGILIQLFRGI